MLLGIFFFILLLIFIFYFYPAMKQQWQKHNRNWKYYYEICGDENRQTYTQLLKNLILIHKH